MNYILLDLLERLKDQVPHISSLKSQFILKADDSPVSKADIFIEKLIYGFLRERLKNVLLLGEESLPLGNEDAEFHVLVDPLDGTENFVSGLPIWGISVGVWREKKNIENLLFFPELDCYAHESNLKKPINLSRIKGYSSSINNELLDSIVPGSEARILGASSYNIYSCLRGYFASFSNPSGAWSWDLLPGANLCLKSGIPVIVNGEKYNGELLDTGSKHKFKIGL